MLSKAHRREKGEKEGGGGKEQRAREGRRDIERGREREGMRDMEGRRERRRERGWGVGGRERQATD